MGRVPRASNRDSRNGRGVLAPNEERKIGQITRGYIMGLSIEKPNTNVHHADES